MSEAKTGSATYPDFASASARLFARAGEVLPGGNTRTTLYHSPYPIYAKSGSGSRVRDADGVERFDFLNNYTALIHGHAHPNIVRAASTAVAEGSCFGLPTESEIRLAEILVDRIPTAELVRFMNSGTEAVMMAVKAARAYTGRSKIAKCEGAYHGGYDFAEVSTDSGPTTWGESDRPRAVAYSTGTPDDVLESVVVLPFNDVENSRRLLEESAEDLAAILIDPLPNRVGLIPASEEFLTMLRVFCSRHGVVLISDEVISFRIGYAGAMAQFGIDADLTTLGKVIGGGFPVGAVVGRRDIMAVFDPSRGKPLVPHGGTFNANPVTMAAGAAALEALTRPVLKALDQLGNETRARLQATLHEFGVPWQVTGQASLFRLVPTQADLRDYRSVKMDATAASTLSSFTSELLQQGLLLDHTGLGCLSTVMSSIEVDALVAGTEAVLTKSWIDRPESRT